MIKGLQLFALFKTAAFKLTFFTPGVISVISEVIFLTGKFVYITQKFSIIHYQILLTIPHVAFHILAPENMSHYILSSFTYVLYSLLERNYFCEKIQHALSYLPLCIYSCVCQP